MKELKLSVIIPAHQAGEDLRQCLQSVKLAIPPEVEILVVSDGDDAAVNRLCEQMGLNFLRNPSRQGPAAARNLGARQARGELLLFVDSDIVIPQDSILRVLELFQANPDVAALFGSYDDTPAAGNFLSQYRNLLHHYVHQTSRTEASTFWSGFGAIRRKAFFEVGAFDEQRYRAPSVEDIELGGRLKNGGHRILLCPELQVQHCKRWSISSVLQTDTFYRALPWTELLLRRGAWIDDLNLQKKHRASTAFALGLFVSASAIGWWPQAFLLAIAQGTGLIALNASLYRFFLHRRGFLFTLGVLPWHWLHFLCGAAGFAAGCLMYWGRRPEPQRQPS